MFVPLFRYCYIAISVLEYRYKKQSWLKLWPKLLTENNRKENEIIDEKKTSGGSLLIRVSSNCPMQLKWS